MQPIKLVAAGVVVIALATASSPSRACSLEGPHEHQLNPAAQATDQVAPALTSLTVSEIRRGPATTCGGGAKIAFSVAATDDEAPPAEIGFRLSLASGQLPPGLVLPTTALRSDYGRLPLTWTESAASGEEPFSFTLSAVAVDLAGNESAPQTVLVEDGGMSSGCRIAGDSRPTAGALAFALAALIAARRRPARRRG